MYLRQSNIKIFTDLGVMSLPCCMNEPKENHIEFQKLNSLTTLACNIFSDFKMCHAHQYYLLLIIAH